MPEKKSKKQRDQAREKRKVVAKSSTKNMVWVEHTLTKERKQVPVSSLRAMRKQGFYPD